MIEICFTVHDEHAESLRSAVDLFSAWLAKKAEGNKLYESEQSVTEALVCVGALRQAVHREIPRGNRWFR